MTGRPREHVVYEREEVRRLEVGWWDVRHALALAVSFFSAVHGDLRYLMRKEALVPRAVV